jgi:hypothetical protein
MLIFLTRVVLAGAAILDVLKVIAAINLDGLITSNDWAHIRPTESAAQRIEFFSAHPP